jgi:tRNA threonylcarbamoyladenosine biosynthesis protein TsaB
LALIINLETATRICSVALASDGKILGIKESDEERSHAGMLTLFIDDLLKEHALKTTSLDAIAVSMGPGSYTGLRIGVSTAKGLSYALHKPLIGVPTLYALSSAIAQNKLVKELEGDDTQVLLCPMIDARRMEVYTALYNTDGQIRETISAKIIEKDSFDKNLDQHTIVFFGNGSAKCKEIIKHPNAYFLDGIECSAGFLVEPSEKAFQQKNFENVAYFEPFYLKDFVATIPRRKVI